MLPDRRGRYDCSDDLAALRSEVQGNLRQFDPGLRPMLQAPINLTLETPMQRAERVVGVFLWTICKPYVATRAG